MFCGKLFVYQKVPKLTGTSQVAGPTWMLENVADQRQQRLMATGVVLCLDQLLSLLCFGNFLRELILKTIEHLNSPCVLISWTHPWKFWAIFWIRTAPAGPLSVPQGPSASPRIDGRTPQWALWIQLLKEHCRASRENPEESRDLQLWPFTSYNLLFLWDSTVYKWSYKYL